MFRHFSKQEARNLVFLAVPVFLGQIAQIAMSFVDTVVAGRAGTVDMAAPKGFPNIPVGESAANARDILMKAKTFGTTALVSAPPVADTEHCQRLDALCSAYAAICSAVDVPFVDIFPPLLKSGYVKDLADGVHPGPAGNDMIASALLHAPELASWFKNEK